MNLPATWTLVHTLDLPAREAKTLASSALPLSAPTRAYLQKAAPRGIWGHQQAAIRAALAGQDVCLATSTASGKTLAFHVAAMEHLAAAPHARILAVYPMKALGREQEQRWARALKDAGIAGDVGRLDGSVSARERTEVCRRAQVIIATPDVLHTWLLPRVGQKGHEPVARLLRHLALVVVDEAHAYTGVFGTNSAFLYRRLQHAMAALGGRAQFIAASATMTAPDAHLDKLVGRSFTLVGPDQDTSPRHPIQILMVQPPGARDLHTELASLFAHLRDAEARFIAFFDSRKGTEQMASILQREEEGTADRSFDHLGTSAVLPYKAGYEPEHREIIQQRLTQGSLRGVLSTSALELGMDIPGLNVAVLVGVPPSGTSLHQRIGRVGRSAPGVVLVVDTGSVADDVVFSEPSRLLDRPLNESAIYLESRRIQYIHAMALARPGGEHDGAATAAAKLGAPLARVGPRWPEGFEKLCEAEREGRVPQDLRDMKREAGDQPTTCFMLRDVESHFDVTYRRGLHREPLGSLSWSQVMREAYPGAMYYYTGRAYRVMHVDVRGRAVQVTHAPRYTTQPVPVCARISPQRVVHRAEQRGSLTVAECDLQIWRAVLGFRERRGSRVVQVSYPCSEPARWGRGNFSRTLFTTGVCLSHPALDAPGVDARVLAGLLHEAFLMIVPLDRQDVEGGDDALRMSWGPLASGRRFLVMYDQAYGGLRLSGRLLDDAVLVRALVLVADLADSRESLQIGFDEIAITEPTRAAARAFAKEVTLTATRPEPGFGEIGSDDRVHVLLPRSHGVSAARPGQTFEVHQVFVRPDLGICYRGVWVGEDGSRVPGVAPLEEIAPGSGEVIWGYYDVETGEQSAAA